MQVSLSSSPRHTCRGLCNKVRAKFFPSELAPSATDPSSLCRHFHPPLDFGLILAHDSSISSSSSFQATYYSGFMVLFYAQESKQCRERDGNQQRQRLPFFGDHTERTMQKEGRRRREKKEQREIVSVCLTRGACAPECHRHDCHCTTAVLSECHYYSRNVRLGKLCTNRPRICTIANPKGKVSSRGVVPFEQ